MKVLALVAGVVASLASWYLVGDDLIGVLVLTVYLFSPYGFLAFFKDSSLGSVTRGTALLVLAVMTVWMYLTVATSESSTAALGLFMLPVYQWLAIGLVWISAGIIFGRTRPAGDKRQRVSRGSAQPAQGPPLDGECPSPDTPRAAPPPEQ